MIVYVNGAEREDRRASASDEDHGDHEEENVRRAVRARVDANPLVRFGYGRVEEVARAVEEGRVECGLRDVADVVVERARDVDIVERVVDVEEVRDGEQERAHARHQDALADPSGNVAVRAEVGHEDHRQQIAQLEGRGDHARHLRGNVEALLDRRDHAVPEEELR